MGLAMQFISNDKTVKSNTGKILKLRRLKKVKDFNSQSLATQAKKGEHLVAMMPAIKKTFVLMGGDKVELSTKKESMKNKISSCDEKWLQESKAKLL